MIEPHFRWFIGAGHAAGLFMYPPIRTWVHRCRICCRIVHVSSYMNTGLLLVDMYRTCFRIVHVSKYCRRRICCRIVHVYSYINIVVLLVDRYRRVILFIIHIAGSSFLYKQTVLYNSVQVSLITAHFGKFGGSLVE